MASTAAQKRADLKAAADKGPVLSIEMDGELHSWVWKDDTALSVKAFRHQVGMSPKQLLTQAKISTDLDHVAMVIWMAGERDSYGVPVQPFVDVAASLKYDAEWKVVNADQLVDEEDDSPEA